MYRGEIDYWLKEFRDNKYAFMSKDGKVIPIFKAFEELKKLHNKIDKAIEYINKNKYFYSGLQNEDMEIGLFEDEIDKLLEILKDSDVDE